MAPLSARHAHERVSSPGVLTAVESKAASLEMIRTVDAVVVALLCTQLVCLTGASGLWLGRDMPDSDTCPIGDFRAKLIKVDAYCCGAAAGCTGGDFTPSARCAGTFVSLYATCNRTMTQLLDGMDVHSQAFLQCL
jgi:hypothetical protein